MWSKQLRDKKFRRDYNKKEFKNLAFLFLLKNPTLEKALKLSLLKRFLRSNKTSFKSQIKNRCVLSLRSRSSLRLFRVSRIFFRSLASGGAFLGVKKSSW